MPAEHGAVINVTRSSGVADRYPRWSPDGKTSPTGATAAAIRADAARGGRQAPNRRSRRSAPASAMRRNGRPTARNRVHRPGDADSHLRRWDGKVDRVDQSPDWMASTAVSRPSVSHGRPTDAGSPTRGRRRRRTTRSFSTTPRAKLHQATSGYLNDTQPVFDPEGKYLFYATRSCVRSGLRHFDNTWTYANPTQLVAVPLRKDVKSPLEARNDAESRRWTRQKDDAKKPIEREEA